MSLTEIGWEMWTGLIYWQATINMVMNLGVPQNFRISFSSSATIKLSQTLFHGVSSRSTVSPRLMQYSCHLKASDNQGCSGRRTVWSFHKAKAMRIWITSTTRKCTAPTHDK